MSEVVPTITLESYHVTQIVDRLDTLSGLLATAERIEAEGEMQQEMGEAWGHDELKVPTTPVNCDWIGMLFFKLVGKTIEQFGDEHKRHEADGVHHSTLQEMVPVLRRHVHYELARLSVALNEINRVKSVPQQEE